ncbi:lipocalin family protein [Wenzhouxiangella sp. EGI_FJ10305]|uniref:lipocalin family protein n=1 Tax=Wenzhouxiangella sp. EGI_FJ10305 TaxID=3243768 RepID=UPI0035DFEF66
MRYFLGTIALLALSGCAMMRGGPPLETVEEVDLERYMGQWYVIANIPYFGERGNVAGRAIYRMREDGRMDDIYRYRDGSFDAPEEEMSGVAWVVDTETNAEWKVRFYWPIRFGYYIVGLDDDYQWTVVGHPSREYAWIMAREPELSDERYAALLDMLEARGFDASRLEKVPQRPDQVGKPGFQ